MEERLPRPARGRKKRGPTACADARRGWFNCGVCGSRDVFVHFLRPCPACRADTGEPCRCEVDYEPVLYASFLSCLLKECAACGAVEGPRCPNCGRPAWAKGGRLNCRSCGFQRL